MDNNMEKIVEALNKVGAAQRAMLMSPTVRVIFKHGEPSKVAASFKVESSLEPGGLTQIKKITGISLSKGESPYGFPMWFGQEGVLEYKIYCGSCGPGYEMISKVGSRGKVLRSCQPIQKR